ncbi:hypothetical protein R3P38DRAFT_2533285 [Favolaschia claudopus]|uniref:Uncharacterized protein n=1 Tax=Favolaschia claudopus TaxID=2862362 RepID=A0AAW0B9M7_9AGAR
MRALTATHGRRTFCQVRGLRRLASASEANIRSRGGTSLLDSRVRSPSTPAVPPPSGMRIVPCSPVDDSGPRDWIVNLGLVVPSELCPTRLEDSLLKVIEYKFPRAGARLGLRNGIYEYQIPEKFDASTPAAKFSVKHHLEPCPERSKILPSSLSGLSESKPTFIVSSALDIGPLFSGETSPRTLSAFLQPNVPLMHIHLNTFTDLTLIGVTFPHMAFDGLGIGTVLEAWTRVLNGADIDSISGMSWDMQPFENFFPESEVGRALRPARGWFNPGWFGWMPFLSKLLWEKTQDPTERMCFARVPKAFLNDVKKQIMSELQEQGSTEYVGSSDVLLAWWIKLMYDHRPPSTAPLCVHMTVNLRSLPFFGTTNSNPLTTPYIHNAFTTYDGLSVPISTLQAESLAQVALRIRRGILAYKADPRAIRDDVAWFSANKTILPCPPDGEFNVTTNWRAMELGNLDFSGALVGSEATRFCISQEGHQAARDKGGNKARVAFVHCVVSSKQFLPMRRFSIVLMEDSEAIWIGKMCGDGEIESIAHRESQSEGGVEFVDDFSV